MKAQGNRENGEPRKVSKQPLQLTLDENKDRKVQCYIGFWSLLFRKLETAVPMVKHKGAVGAKKHRNADEHHQETSPQTCPILSGLILVHGRKAIYEVSPLPL